MKTLELACAKLLTWDITPRENPIVTISEQHWLVPGGVTQAERECWNVPLALLLGCEVLSSFQPHCPWRGAGHWLTAVPSPGPSFSELLTDVCCLLIPAPTIHSSLSLMLPWVLFLLNPVSGRGSTTLGWTPSRLKGGIPECLLCSTLCSASVLSALGDLCGVWKAEQWPPVTVGALTLSTVTHNTAGRRAVMPQNMQLMWTGSWDRALLPSRSSH